MLAKDKNKTMAKLHRAFTEEYKYLEHTTEVKIENIKNVSYFSPHHAEYKAEKTSTLFRVIFNANSNSCSVHLLILFY